jgi:predicted ATPase
VITLIEALNFRCLRHVKQPLGPFHALVGPNASGKTTFLDVVAFLGRLVTDGIEAAVREHEHAQNFQDLVWGRSGKSFELVIEACIPDAHRGKLADSSWDTMRYEVGLGIDQETGEVLISGEKALLKKTEPQRPIQRKLFPNPSKPPQTILSPKTKHGFRTVINKVPGRNDNFYSEVTKEHSGKWSPSFKLGPRKSALGNLPADESNFPAATWLKRLLMEGVQQFVLNSRLIRLASPPGQSRGFKPDGSNLPWIVHGLQERDPERFRGWISHLQTALPDLVGLRTIERADDKHRYLMLCYRGGLEVPSWMASDGTLRLLALTLPAYLPAFSGVYLIEEPENGIHPRAMETVFQSLSSVYDAQLLLATHSPIILSLVDAGKVLCFAKTHEGATDIVSGSEHPALREWRGETSLGSLFAGGVLG